MTSLRFIFLLVLFGPSLALAETQYIDDTLFAPLRSGQGLEYRIVHKGLRSGTPVEILETDETSGYTRVRTNSGLEGWLPTRYLTSEPVAKDKLDKLIKEHQALQSRFQALSTESRSTSSEKETLAAELEKTRAALNQTQEELISIRKVSQNALQLDVTNKELRESNERLKSEVEVLTSENLRLKDKNEQDTMLLSAGLVLLGIIIALVVPMFKREKRGGWS